MTAVSIGIIAEDQSDVDVAQEIFLKYAPKNNFRIRKFIGNGCGKIKGKLSPWASQLVDQGCKFVIVLHDLDRNQINKLRAELQAKVPKNLVKICFVCIPVEELEAWLLADPEAIRQVFGLKKTPKKQKQCETIASPKEFLRDLIWLSARKRYVNSIHNVKLAKHSDLNAFRTCPSFQLLDAFITGKVFPLTA